MTLAQDMLPEKVRAKIEFSDDGCWEWTAYRNRDGYGHIRWNGRMAVAHRVVYQLLIGPIPDDLQIDHLCRVRHCVRPDHMEPVTQAENVRRGISWSAVNATKTHCPQGHLYDEVNTYVYRERRYCRACKQERRASRKAVA